MNQAKSLIGFKYTTKETPNDNILNLVLDETTKMKWKTIYNGILNSLKKIDVTHP